MLPHLGAGYTLARWLTRNTHDAEDCVQESFLRAFRAFPGFRGGDARAWVLKIVRNRCLSLLARRPPEDPAASEAVEPRTDPEIELLRRAEASLVREVLSQIPAEYRESLVLREFEGLSYKEIAEVAGVPLGTVMSRLSRGRRLLQDLLLKRLSRGGPP